MVELIIDGQKISTQPGTSVMDAALENGIDIPRLCYHPELSVSGNCRLCMVQVEGQARPTPSCGLTSADGMVVVTQSPELRQIRRDIINLYLADHPLNCLTCEKSGACQLQKYAYEVGIQETSLEVHVGRTLFQDDNPFFIRDHKFCILCGRCVRVCDEIVGANAINFSGRGFHTHIATPLDSPLAETSCVFCGNCVQVCPTAALMPVSRYGKGREWDLEKTRTICGYCGVGCEVEYSTRNGEIVYAQSSPDAPVNADFLCTKGRFGWDFATNPDRLKTPLVRKDLAYERGLTDELWEMPQESPLASEDFDLTGSYISVDWDSALDLVAEKLAATVSQYGPDSVMGLSSARCTNEENYIFQKFMRAGIGTNNLDHCARL